MLIIKADRCVGDDLAMKNSLHVLHNQATAQDYRHETRLSRGHYPDGPGLMFRDASHTRSAG
jgi:hypothetical protein